MMSSILMPALPRLRKQARVVACQALLKQWGVIWAMYCDDNNGRFFEASNLGWLTGTWVVALRPQHRTKSKILICPAPAKRRLSGGAAELECGDSTHTYITGSGGIFDWREEASYGANNWLYYAMGTGAIRGRRIPWNWRTEDIGQAANISLFSDTMWRGGEPRDQTSETGASSRASNHTIFPQYDGQRIDCAKETMMDFAINHHQTRANMLCMDWSVRPVGLKELWTLKWHRRYPTNGSSREAGGVQPSDWPEWMKNFKDYR
jgi:hypothetical protein